MPVPSSHTPCLHKNASNSIPGLSGNERQPYQRAFGDQPALVNILPRHTVVERDHGPFSTTVGTPTELAQGGRYSRHHVFNVMRTSRSEEFGDAPSLSPEPGICATSVNASQEEVRKGVPDQGNHSHCNTSPALSLRRARQRALTITGAPEVLHPRKQEESQGVGHMVLHGNNKYEDNTAKVRCYESPFAQRVREKLRQAHAGDHDETSLSTATTQYESLGTVDSGSSPSGSVSGTTSDRLLFPHPPSDESEGLEMSCPSKTPESGGDAHVQLHRIAPYYQRTTRPDVVMPRRPKLVPAPGSVMDRVMMLEERVRAVQEEFEAH
ncbi:hypothetical protein BC834DRAFT_24965 [Gloeopeniophorella convolvens]|nr:hypothetical protein BC834DRAFT_24965 [Gloeopeniophorella convolvens]